MNSLAVITKWIVAFLVIFLLCMLLVFHFIKKRDLMKENKELERRKQLQHMYFLY